MSTTEDLRSTGQMCADFQVSHARIVRAIEALVLVPRLRMNGVAYFDAEAQDAIRGELDRVNKTNNANRGGRSVAMA